MYREYEDDLQLLNDGSVWMISDQRFKTIKAVVAYHSELAPNHKRTNKSTIQFDKAGIQQQQHDLKTALPQISQISRKGFQKKHTTNPQDWISWIIPYFWKHNTELPTE